MAARTSSRICFRSSLSSGKDCGSGSRLLSVRNFNKTEEAEEEEEGEEEWDVRLEEGKIIDVQTTGNSFKLCLVRQHLPNGP